jgi:hypothetical protein
VHACIDCLILHTFVRVGYSNSDNSWLRRTAFAAADLLDAFDEDADASDLLIEQHRAQREACKARIEDGTHRLQAEGMSYTAAYEKAFIAEFAKGGRGKRVRNSTQPPI